MGMPVGLRKDLQRLTVRSPLERIRTQQRIAFEHLRQMGNGGELEAAHGQVDANHVGREDAEADEGREGGDPMD
jgi:hypothetical protein